jgi:hypothetical protein
VSSCEGLLCVSLRRQLEELAAGKMNSNSVSVAAQMSQMPEVCLSQVAIVSTLPEARS